MWEGVEFACTGEGISQQPEKGGHFLWNERKAGMDGYRYKQIKVWVGEV